MKRINLAIIGATGLVGNMILQILQERKLPINHIYFFSSKRSANTPIFFDGREYVVEELQETSLDQPIDIALFAAGGGISQKYAKIAADKGIVVVDNSSVFRMAEGVPLVVPEVNPDTLKNHRGIVANPNCTTTQATVALKPLDEKFSIKRIVYSTYQSVSGSGVGGLKDLEEGTLSCYPHPIQYNAIPHIDSFLDNGYTKEEMKMVEETRKILNKDHLRITATTVRVPIKYAHSISINVEFEKPFELEQIYDVLGKAPGIVVKDDVKNNSYPMALDVEGKDEVFVGRIRRDFSVDHGLNLWVVGDNLRKGAATNAVQIVEHLIGHLEKGEEK